VIRAGSLERLNAILMTAPSSGLWACAGWPGLSGRQRDLQPHWRLWCSGLDHLLPAFTLLEVLPALCMPRSVAGLRRPTGVHRVMKLQNIL